MPLLRFRSFAVGVVLVAGCAKDEELDASTRHASYAGVPQALAADDTTLFVATGTTIETRDLSGENPTVFVAEVPSVGASSTQALTIHDLTPTKSGLYWLQDGSGVVDVPTALVRAPKNGSAEVLIEADAQIARYVVTDSLILACGNAGGATILSASSDDPAPTFSRTPLGNTTQRCQDLFVDAGGTAHVAISKGDAVEWYALDSSSPDSATLETKEPMHPGIRWVTGDGKSDLVRVDESGERTVLATQASATPFVSDGTTAYFKSGLGGGNVKTRKCETGKVSRVSAGSAPVVMTEAQCYPSAFALTSSRVFWLDDIGGILNIDRTPETALKSMPR